MGCEVDILINRSLARSCQLSPREGREGETTCRAEPGRRLLCARRPRVSWMIRSLRQHPRRPPPRPSYCVPSLIAHRPWLAGIALNLRTPSHPRRRLDCIDRNFAHTIYQDPRITSETQDLLTTAYRIVPHTGRPRPPASLR